MKKIIFYLFSIIFVLSFITIIKIYELQAYDPAYPNQLHYGPGLVNSFDAGAHIPPMQFPPVGSEQDAMSWRGMAPFPIPTPKYEPYGAGGTVDPGSPATLQGQNYMRMTWTGKGTSSLQWLLLSNDKFQNVGCGALTTTAGDWSCYEYLRLHFYMNTQANGGYVPGNVSQTVALNDGSMTFTSFAVDVPAQTNLIAPGFTRHITVSLRYIANQYNPDTGRYFSISNVAGVVIPAVSADYSLLSLIPKPSEGYPDPDYRSIIMYYDWLTLGAKMDPYKAPMTRSADVLYNGPYPYGVNVTWHPLTYTALPGRPITAFHIYRSTGGSGGPWINTGYFPSSTMTAYADTALPISNAMIWYKVLTCDGGRTILPENENLNTINATYHEDFLANATPFGVFVPLIPTPTITPTVYGGGGPIVSPTITPTETASPIPTVDQQQGLTEAHVFPNPFNPNDGSKKFKVQNVPIKTKVQIFSMDGSLVVDGEVKTSAGFIWDGKNKNGSKVVSGLYYLVMKDPNNKTRVERVIVCYKCKTVDNGE